VQRGVLASLLRLRSEGAGCSGAPESECVKAIFSKLDVEVLAKDFAGKSDEELFLIMEKNLELLVSLRDIKIGLRVKDGRVWRQAMADIVAVRRELDRAYQAIGGLN
jgi:hypothetical protein